MKVTYKDREMERLCLDKSYAVHKLNITIAKNLGYCHELLIAYDSVERMIADGVRHTHRLNNYRNGVYYAMNLSANFRLIFAKETNEGTLCVVRIEEITAL